MRADIYVTSKAWNANVKSDSFIFEIRMPSAAAAAASDGVYILEIIWSEMTAQMQFDYLNTLIDKLMSYIIMIII